MGAFLFFGWALVCAGTSDARLASVNDGAADAVRAGETGFRFVHGRVQRVGESRNTVYLDLGARFSVTIARADWRRYFRGRPADYLHQTLEVRGWITEQNDRRRLRVHHPAMITKQ